MEKQTIDMDSLRADYRLVRRWWRESDGWCDADLAEADDGIKAAVDMGDAELIACWANWLSKKANDIRGGASRVRDIEAKAREKGQA